MGMRHVVNVAKCANVARVEMSARRWDATCSERGKMCQCRNVEMSARAIGWSEMELAGGWLSCGDVIW